MPAREGLIAHELNAQKGCQSQLLFLVWIDSVLEFWELKTED
jgi:hypothetical protein